VRAARQHRLTRRPERSLDTAMKVPPMTLTDPIEALLASGGDSRQIVDPDSGTNKYGCGYVPDPSLVSFGSCTASTISRAGYASAERVAGWIRAIDEPFLCDALDDLHTNVRQQLGSMLVDRSTPEIDIALTPSGTDGELIALELFASRSEAPVENIVVGPAEVGSGTTLAAAGREFDCLLPNGGRGESGRPVDDDLAGRTTVRRIGMRSRGGDERDDRDVDAEVIELVNAAIERSARVLIHVVAHSKTGVHAPSLDTVQTLEQHHGDRVGVVIDAAQGRFSRRGLNESLRAGRMVIVTGSKFFGGPPFAGALLVPAAWAPPAGHRFPAGFGQFFTSSQMPASWSAVRSALPSTHNVGLLLRWHAALAEMSSYYAVPSRLRLEVLRAFEAMVPEIWSRSPRVRINAVSPPLLENETQRLLESKTTVFPFSVSTAGRDLTYAELGNVYRWMRNDIADLVPAASPSDRDVLSKPIQLGQPVRLSWDERGAAVLRIAISATRITSTCVGMESGASFDDRLGLLRYDLEITLAKLDLIAAHYDTIVGAT
jgi:hypothetical protein